MKVSDIMTKAVVTDSAGDTLTQAAAKMREHQTGSLLIMDGKDLQGIFTERDLLKSIALGANPNETTVKECMTYDVITITADATLREAAGIMASKWIRHLPVVDGSEVKGLISQRDLVGILDTLLQEPESAPQLAEGELVRNKRIRRIQAGDLD